MGEATQLKVMRRKYLLKGLIVNVRVHFVLNNWNRIDRQFFWKSTRIFIRHVIQISNQFSFTFLNKPPSDTKVSRHYTSKSTDIFTQSPLLVLSRGLFVFKTVLNCAINSNSMLFLLQKGKVMLLINNWKFINNKIMKISMNNHKIWLNSQNPRWNNLVSLFLKCISCFKSQICTFLWSFCIWNNSW